jgi:NAD(P)-dependent dehydrogenase (short-subunit alcohol dehydrogenase family)
MIGTGILTRESLAGQVAVVTGAGRNIGFEAARALAWLGAHVILAEIDKRTGRDAAARITSELGFGTATFIHTDVGNKRSVARLARRVLRAHGKVDIVLNNATVAPMGAVHQVPIKAWDASYRVNLRGPVLLAHAFLPGMIERDHGVFVCVSSVGEAYMGAYECLKAAQAHLGQTLDAEFEGTGVIAFAIGPGIVRTSSTEAAIGVVAPLYGKTVEEFYAMSEAHLTSVEAAGAGFAAAIALAERFRGDELGSAQALQAAGISLAGQGAEANPLDLDDEELAQALALCREVRTTLAEQAEGWKQRSLFERQWVVRDFKKHAGMTVQPWLETLDRLEHCLEEGDLDAVATLHVPLEVLARYYEHLQELAAGYEQDPTKLEEQLTAIRGWQASAEHLGALLGRPGYSRDEYIEQQGAGE